MAVAAWRPLLISALLLLCGLAQFYVKPQQRLAQLRPPMDLQAAFPEHVGEWRVDTLQPALIVAPDVAAMLDRLYAKTLDRVYVNARGQRLMLSVAYGGDQSDATRAHRPDVCYPVQGFQLRDRERQQLRLNDGMQLPLQRMVAEQIGRTEPVSFWFVIGDYTAVSPTEQKLRQLRYGLRGQIPDGLLVRVSSLERDVPLAYAQQDGFIRSLHQQLSPTWRPRVFGVAPSSTGLP